MNPNPFAVTKRLIVPFVEAMSRLLRSVATRADEYTAGQNFFLRQGKNPLRGSRRDSRIAGIRAIRNGRVFAAYSGVMPRKRAPIDQLPGRFPEIRTDGDSVTFKLALPGLDEQTRLVLRCDPDGNVWASIASRRLTE
jgi:hypothetical protein